MRLGLLLSALLVVGVPGAARAQETPSEESPQEAEYDRLVDEALAEFDAGHFEEALAAFEQAYKVKPSARALRGVAKALFELRSYARCIEAIDRALASDVDPLTSALREDVESLRARAKRFVGEVLVDVVPRTATVVLDGEVIDVDPATPRVLDVGAHTVEASAPAHHPQSRRFEIHGGEVTRVPIRLDPVRAVVDGTVTPPAPPPSPHTESRTIPLALTIGAVVASTGAVVGSSIWFVDRGGAVDLCNEAAAAGARCENAGSIAFQRDASAWTLGLSGTALAASVLALVLVIRGDDRPAPRTAAWTW